MFQIVIIILLVIYIIICMSMIFHLKEKARILERVNKIYKQGAEQREKEEKSGKGLFVPIMEIPNGRYQVHLVSGTMFWLFDEDGSSKGVYGGPFVNHLKVKQGWTLEKNGEEIKEIPPKKQ